MHTKNKNLEYFVDGEKFICKRHYKKLYLDYGMHLQKFMSPKAGLCHFCAQENETLVPRAKVFPAMNLRRFIESVHGIIDPLPSYMIDAFDPGLTTMPDGHLRWVFPKFMSLRRDQQRALSSIAPAAKFLSRLIFSWRSNRWTLEVFRITVKSGKISIDMPHRNFIGGSAPEFDHDKPNKPFTSGLKPSTKENAPD